MVSFQSSMWIASAAGISKILCRSEVASATRTSARMRHSAAWHKLLKATRHQNHMCVDETLKRPALSININDHVNRPEMVLFAEHMYKHSKGIEQAHVQENKGEARSPQVVIVWSLDFKFRS